MIRAEDMITLTRVDDGEGQDGKSAYESAVDGGYTGTEEEFNADLADTPNKVSVEELEQGSGKLSGKNITSDLIGANSINANKINLPDLFAQNFYTTGDFIMGTNALIYDSRTGELTINATNVLTQSYLNGFMNFGLDANHRPTLVLGAPTSQFKTEITNEAINFKQGDNVIAYLSNNELNISSSVVSEASRIGNYMWFPRIDDTTNKTNLSLVWLG